MPASLAADVVLKWSLPRGRGRSPEVPLRRRTQSRRAVVFSLVSRALAARREMTCRWHAIERWGQVRAKR